MDLFKFCGKIALGKDSDKFHPVDRREFSSGWTNTTVRFNCLSDMNRILCTTQGGKWKDDSKNVIKTFSKSTTDANGNVTRGEMIDIPWNKRFDADQIDKVAGFRKFVCDTGDIKMRYRLQDVVGNKTEIDEELVAVGINSIDDAKIALEKSLAKKKVFLSEYDFAEYIARVAASEKFKDKLFYISGFYDVAYNAEKDRFYTNYHVNRVVLAPDDAEPNTELKIDFYFGENAWNDNQYEETGKVYISGWINYYDNMVKKNGFMPLIVAVKENSKKVAALKRKFEVDDSDAIKQIGLTLKVIDGAERVEITMDMLDEETRSDIELGLLDFEELKRELGGVTIGDRISELKFIELTPKKNSVQNTIYTIDDMHAAKAVQVEETEDIDIFSDDDEDDL